MESLEEKCARLEEELAEARARINALEFGDTGMPDEIRRLAEFSVFPVVVTTMQDGRFLLANKAARKFLAIHDVPLDTVSAKAFWCNPAERELFVSTLDAFDEVHEFSACAKLHDGATREVVLSARKVLVQGVAASFTAVYDNSALCEAERVIQGYVRRYELLASQVRDVIWALDVQRRLTFVTPSAERLLGYKLAEIERLDPAAWLPVQAFEIFETFPEEHSANGAAVQPRVRELRTELVRKDGTTIWTQSSISPMLDANGCLEGIVGLTRDNTEQVRLQRELEIASEEARIACRVKSEFLANMSHEIRTPLNGIMGMLQILQSTALDAEQLDCVETAIISGRSLLSVIGDILDYSKIEAGRIKLSTEWCELEGVLQTLMRSFQGMLSQKNVELAYRIAPEVPASIMTDNVRLRQILFNLLSNAAKFTMQGNIRLDVTLESAAEDRAVLGFTVVDTGVGIPPQKAQQLFEPFTQFDGSYTRRYPGTGLGLSIVHRLVSMMGGIIDMQSEEGHGTKVWFTLPVGIESKTDCLDTDSRRRARGEGEGIHILLVDDDKYNEKVVANMLRKHGFEVTGSPNGRHALDELLHSWFDAVILDIQMPEMDGVEVTRRIRTDPAFAHVVEIPIIALTAHAMQGDRERFLSAGMDAYLPKPVDMQEMLGTIARTLQLKRSAR